MIVHIFTAKRYHLVPSIAKGFVTIYKDSGQHKILLWGRGPINWQLYDDLFQEVGFADYFFCESKWKLFKLLRKDRSNSVLFHAGSYSHFLIAFIAGCRNVNWVCWGSGASIRNSWRSRLLVLPKSWIYRHFSSIVTLMDADRDSIIHDFKVNPARVRTIPYASSGGKNQRDEICLSLLKNEMKKNIKPVVLLGNNPSNMVYYIKLMDFLKPFKGKICVHCMMNYSVNKNQQYEDFIKHGTDLFGDDFKSNEEFYEGNLEFVNYMNTCDVYMCGCPDQTGLGALSTVLELGKKAFVTGKNYDWATKECGAKVFNISDIKDYEGLVKPLSTEEKLQNYNAIIKTRDLPPLLWKEYLRQLNTKNINEVK